MAGVLLLTGAVAAALVFLAAMREAIDVFLMGRERLDLPRSIVFEAVLSGYLIVALLRRCLARDFRVGIVPRFALEGFARAWGIAVSVLIAANLADLARGSPPTFSPELVRDVVLYATVMLILLIPALLALAVAKRLSPH